MGILTKQLIIYSWAGRQTDKSMVYKVDIFLDGLLVSEIYVIPNFMKIVRTVLEIYDSCFLGQTNR